MISIVKKCLLVSAAASCFGCATRWNGPEHALTIAEEHPIAVDSQVVTMTIAPSSALTSLDQSRARAFAESYMRDGHGALAVTAAPGADSDDVRAALVEAGVPESSIVSTAYREGAGRDVILSYTRYVATPSACGIWEGGRERDYRNMRTPNFGCASQNNLAAMIGDPHDLIEPAAMTAPDAMIRIRGVEKFRKGEVTSSKTDSEVNAEVSSQ